MRGIELTTIGQKKYEMGALAVKKLVERIEGDRTEPPKEIILEPELIIRKTCGFHLKRYQIEPKDGRPSSVLHHPLYEEGIL